MRFKYRPAALLCGLSALLFSAACSEPIKTPEEILRDVPRYSGKTVTIETKVRGGVRCKLETEGGQWQTYCGDCQQCEGPFIVDMGQDDLDWPMVVMGTYEGQRVGCSGRLNEMTCNPLKPGKTYRIHGLLQRGEPPRLLMKGFSLVDSKN